jgi:CAAX protease family protein
MRPLRALGIYTAVVFIGGALLSPWVYRLVQNLGRSYPEIATTPFARYVSSTLMLVALAGLWPLLKSLSATSLRGIGLTSPLEHGRQLLGGLVLGLASLAVVAGLVVIFSARDFNHTLTSARLVKKLSGAVFTAAGVAVLEEALFRGGIFGGLRRVFHWPFALLVSSMIYSLTHFLGDVDYHSKVTWVSGLEVLPRMFGSDISLAAAVPRFLNLTLAGTLLGLAYQRTGNLWLSIGMHAGWIFWLATYRVITNETSVSATWFWGTNKMIDGWLAFLALGLTLALFSRLPLARKDYYYA